MVPADTAIASSAITFFIIGNYCCERRSHDSFACSILYIKKCKTKIIGYDLNTKWVHVEPEFSQSHLSRVFFEGDCSVKDQLHRKHNYQVKV